MRPPASAKTVVTLALIAIAGLAISVAVVVGAVFSGPRAATVVPDAGVMRRPKLAADHDVRTTALHRAHLEAAEPLECAACHDLSQKEFVAPPLARCAGCHQQHEPSVHQAGTAASSCFACHDFLLVGDAAAAARNCLGCHQTAQGTRAAVEIHGKEDCLACHRVHEPGAKARTPCLECHAGEKTGHLAGLADGKECLGCHRPHEKAPVAMTGCAECHARRGPIIPATATFAGHDRCTTCHEDHDRTRASVRLCTACHEHQPVLAADQVAEHRNCVSCHDPHDPLGDPAARCAKCHEQVASSHPRDRAGRVCTACHPPHQRASAGAAVLGCTSGCHSERRQAGEGHGPVACQDCHVPHAFRLAETGAGLCRRCHQRPIGKAPAIVTSAGHAECRRCHTRASHAPASPPVPCATCHVQQAGLVSHGHSDCARCHEPHDGALRRDAQRCGSCHRDQVSTAPAGHADCRSCHDKHSGKLLADAVQCVSCHSDRRGAPHDKVDGGCRTCHRPHGPKGPAKIPTCTSCHDPRKLPGSHKIAEHDSCSDCHQAHPKARVGRETCLRCHTAQRTHEPDAQFCQGCHGFQDDQ